MKCSTCGLNAEVIRIVADGFQTIRDYGCIHGHKFITVEVFPIAVTNESLKNASKWAQSKTEKYNREQQILEDLSSMSAQGLGEKYGLSEEKVLHLHNKIFNVKEAADDYARLRPGPTRPESEISRPGVEQHNSGSPGRGLVSGKGIRCSKCHGEGIYCLCSDSR